MTATALLIVAVVLSCFPIAGADDSLDEILKLEKSDREKIANG